MSRSLEFTIREQLAKYLSHEISLRDFKDWFFSSTWDVDRIGDPVLTDLVYDIKLDLAEFSHGDWTEEELHDLLRSYLEKQVIGIPENNIKYGTLNPNISIPVLANPTVVAVPNSLPVFKTHLQRSA